MKEEKDVEAAEKSEDDKEIHDAAPMEDDEKKEQVASLAQQKSDDAKLEETVEQVKAEENAAEPEPTEDMDNSMAAEKEADDESTGDAGSDNEAEQPNEDGEDFEAALLEDDESEDLKDLFDENTLVEDAEVEDAPEGISLIQKDATDGQEEPQPEQSDETQPFHDVMDQAEANAEAETLEQADEDMEVDNDEEENLQLDKDVEDKINQETIDSEMKEDDIENDADMSAVEMDSDRMWVGRTREDCCRGKNGSGYRGRQTKTRSGKRCMAWANSITHTKAFYPHAGLDSNFCRNPDPNHSKAIWCFVENTSGSLTSGKAKHMWEYCKPIPGGKPRPPPRKPPIDDGGSKGGGDWTIIVRGRYCTGYRKSIFSKRSPNQCMNWVRKVDPWARFFFFRSEGNYHCSPCPTRYTGGTRYTAK